MKKYSVIITRTDAYEVEVDENVWDEKELNGWSKVFWPIYDTKGVAENAAMAVMRNGAGSGFIEGFGVIKTFNWKGNEIGQSSALKESGYSPGLSIKVISEDNEYETDIEEI